VNRSRGSLSLRISVLTVSVAVITAAIGALIAIPLVRQATENGARQTLSRPANEVDAEVADAPVRTLLALRALKVDSATIGARGRVTGTNQTARLALTPAQIQSVLSGHSVSAVQDVEGRSVLVEARPTPSGGFVLVQPRTDALAAANQAVDRLLVALLIACAVAVILGLLVSWRLARPLKRTAAAAHALADGARDVVVNPSGPAEVAEVADALNYLGDSVTRSEERQRQFLLSVSHDLRTPLTAIRGYAESLADGMIDPQQVPRVGSVVLGEAQRLDRFVTDLLDLARLDAQDVRMDIVDVDLVALIESTAAVWTLRCAAEQVPVYVELPPGPLWVRTDPARLRQVLDGLLENALRVVPAGRPIVLAARAEINSAGCLVAVAEIRDGGPGLTDDDIEVAFDRSALHDRYRGIRQVGTGLGLAIVHHLVSRLGGTVEAGHAAEGGARFTVRLPVPAAAPVST
jgi:two-component system, OmpR family, sensor kinase